MLNLDRLSSKQQWTLVMLFFSLVLVLIYINILSLLNGYVLQPQNNAFIPWNKTKHLLPYHPSLVVIGSVNGGTTLINHLYLFLDSFHDREDEKPRDTFYWTQCIPCDQYLNRTHDFYQWNVSQSNLCTPIFESHQTLALKAAQQIRSRLRMHASHTSDTTYAPKKDATVKCTIEDYKSQIIPYYPSNAMSHFSAERCSAYIYAPYVAKIISTFFTKSILLYAIREKATQQYSRAKNFHKSNTFKDGEIYFNAQFNFHWTEIESKTVQNGLVPLLEMKQSDKIRDDIVLWYLSYSSVKGRKPSPFEIDFKDLCPYINVLVYMKILSVFNAKYGFSKLKIVQSEWLFSDLLRSLRFIHCVVVVKNWNSKQEMKHCDEYYEGHMNYIISHDNIEKLMDNKYGKKSKYEYLLSDLNAFDALSQFWSLCDKRLFELIEEYPSLTVGTEWNYNVWREKRKKMKSAVVVNMKTSLR